MSILGNRVLRREDPKFLTTGGVYGDDLPLEGALWATYVRSPEAHARIVSIDKTDAASLPGLVAVYTADDIPLGSLPSGLPGIPEAMSRPVLAKGVVRFVGEPVALVLTEERYQGEDAAEAVYVEYQSLPPLVDPLQAEHSEIVLFPEHGTNIATDFRELLPGGFFDGCDVVVRQRVVN
ncbi:MAG TPA: xanthine dehydrogenase family protein molybdopterin-binding subunit, partial [Acidimicrobiales bacterium]|nr:xanthine dehydrogenase family protein molybdopterin-binding subunit [Acidimicrobiales bacterium]